MGKFKFDISRRPNRWLIPKTYSRCSLEHHEHSPQYAQVIHDFLDYRKAWAMAVDNDYNPLSIEVILFMLMEVKAREIKAEAFGEVKQ